MVVLMSLPAVPGFFRRHGSASRRHAAESGHRGQAHQDDHPGAANPICPQNRLLSSIEEWDTRRSLNGSRLFPAGCLSLPHQSCANLFFIVVSEITKT